MEISKRFIGFYLSFLIISTLGYILFLDPLWYNTFTDFVFDSLFYYLDYLLLGVYMFTFSYREPNSILSLQLFKLLALSYILLFVNPLTFSYFILKLDQLDSYSLVGNLIIRAFQTVIFIFLAMEIKHSKPFNQPSFWAIIISTFIALGLLNYSNDLDWVKGLSLCILSGVYFLAAYYLSRQKKQHGYSLAFAAFCLALTELYFGLLFFEDFRSFVNHRGVIEFLDISVVFRFFGSLCELWIVSILLKGYFPKVVIH